MSFFKSLKKRLLGVGDTLSDFHAEMDRRADGISFVIGGILSVCDIDDKRAVLRSVVGKIVISGENIKISVFENKTVEISGKLRCVEFSYGKH